MKSIIKTITLLSLLMLASSAVFAQAERRTVIDIPFAFHVGEKTLPAGQYRIEPNRRDSDKVWVIRRTDNSAGTVVMANQTWSNKVPESAQLIFHRYGDQYFLSQVWTAGANAGIELPITRQERAVEVASTDKRETYLLTASRD